MWRVRVGGVHPDTRTDEVGVFDDLEAVRAYLAPLRSPEVKLVERQCGPARVQFILKDPETRGVAGVVAHLEAVVFEAEELTSADDVHCSAARCGPADPGVEQTPG
jgi:hypothetical protein